MHGRETITTFDLLNLLRQGNDIRVGDGSRVQCVLTMSIFLGFTCLTFLPTLYNIAIGVFTLKIPEKKVIDFFA